MNKREAIISLAAGAGAGALVGLGIWWFASKKIDESFQQGGEQLASRLMGGSAEMQRALTQGREQLRSELAVQVEAQVRPAVRSEIQRTMTSYGITPETGRRVASVLAYAERMNFI